MGLTKNRKRIAHKVRFVWWEYGDDGKPKRRQRTIRVTALKSTQIESVKAMAEDDLWKGYDRPEVFAKEPVVEAVFTKTKHSFGDGTYWRRRGLQ